MNLKSCSKDTGKLVFLELLISSNQWIIQNIPNTFSIHYHLIRYVDNLSQGAVPKVKF